MGQPNHQLLEYARDNDGELPEPFLIEAPVFEVHPSWRDLPTDELWEKYGRFTLELVIWVVQGLIALVAFLILVI